MRNALEVQSAWNSHHIDCVAADRRASSRESNLAVAEYVVGLVVGDWIGIALTLVDVSKAPDQSPPSSDTGTTTVRARGLDENNSQLI